MISMDLQISKKEETMELTKKLCPFFGVGSHGAPCICHEDNCALWIINGCAIAAIAEEMQSTSAAVDQIFESVSEISMHTTPTNPR